MYVFQNKIVNYDSRTSSKKVENLQIQRNGAIKLSTAQPPPVKMTTSYNNINFTATRVSLKYALRVVKGQMNQEASDNQEMVK